ncbi:MAG: TetR/AcrR family transcriptional regulator [Oscillospiraceae bacterium]|jgi:AcrR family transcriptional regulator|nr:TetR/AcrR family transcriptional regulator [Oscillospiraceae bacterium]
MKENQRVRITKQMLKEALMHILLEKPIGKITIYEICQKANINRSTFYKYYGSQYDLLNELENDLFHQVELRLSESKTKDYKDGILKLLEEIAVIKQMAPFHMENFPDANFEREFTKKLFNLPIINELITENTSDDYAAWEKEYLKVFFCHGGYAIIRSWIEKNTEESSQEITDLIVKIGNALFS